MNPLYDPYVLILANAMWRTASEVHSLSHTPRVELEMANHNSNCLSEGRAPLYPIPPFYLARARMAANGLTGTVSSGGLDNPSPDMVN